MPKSIAAVLLFALAAACTPAAPLLSDGLTAVSFECPAGKRVAPSGQGCEPVTPDAECPAGSMPVAGLATCQPVGWTACDAGFAADPSGWACSAVEPAGPCAGATRRALGQTSCVPVGDCAAPFPPAAATLFVDDGYTAAQLDATHFSSLASAVAAAPTGATIAIEAGRYPVALTPPRAVTLAGRCPGQVFLDGSAATEGVLANGIKGVKVSGLTLSGHRVGAKALNGGTLELTDVVVEGSLQSALHSQGANSSLVARTTVVARFRPRPRAVRAPAPSPWTARRCGSRTPKSLT